MATTIDWPSSLPSFILTSWNYGLNSSMIKTDMEVGPPKRRMRTTTQRPIVSGTLELSAAQLVTLREFIETTLSYGTLSFNWPEFVTGKTKEVVLSIDTNGELYSVKQKSEQTYEVALTLEVQP